MGRACVLIVDDSPLIRQVVADAFQLRGWEIVVAGDGAEALRKIASAQPDLVIADILMPVVDGWRLCEEVRRSPITADLPFIFLSTEKEVKQRVRGLRAGADDYVTKPFAPEELLARAERLLDRIQRLRELAVSSDGLSGHTRHLPIADLLQILSLNARTGTLRLQRPGEPPGRIHFREGRIVQAGVGAVDGEKALFRLMTWPECRFVLEGLDPGVEEAIRGTTSSVLMEGFTHWDELRELGPTLPSPAARYRVPKRVEAFIEEIEHGAVERDLLQGIRLGVALGDLLDALPHRDLDIYRALLGLMRKGFLELLETEADTVPLPRTEGAL